MKWEDIEVNSTIRVEMVRRGSGPRLTYSVMFEGRVESVTESTVLLGADGRRASCREVEVDSITLISPPPLLTGYYLVEAPPFGGQFVRYWDDLAAAWMVSEKAETILSGERNRFTVIKRIIQH